MEKKTPLYEEHVKLAGKVVPFAGYLLPVQYSGVIAEHMAVREKVGIFDVSHMGEVVLKGKDALNNLNQIMTNKFDNMKVGACRYTLMLYPNGTQVDDLIVYKKAEQEYLLVINASNTEKDFSWMKEQLEGDCEISNISEEIAQIALQGPQAKQVIKNYCNVEELPTKYYTFTDGVEIAGCKCLVSRTGYTGEFGYEIYLDVKDAATVWKAFIEGGALPCGLGARDTLRLEASMPLYGHELSDEIHVASTGLSFAIKMDKESFVGKEAIEKAPDNHPVRVGLQVIGRGIVREGAEVQLDGKKVGITTSGTHCPYLEAAYAMAYVDADCATVDTELTALVRGREIAVKVVSLPFYKK